MQNSEIASALRAWAADIEDALLVVTCPRETAEQLQGAADSMLDTANTLDQEG